MAPSRQIVFARQYVPFGIYYMTISYTSSSLGDLIEVAAESTWIRVNYRMLFWNSVQVLTRHTEQAGKVEEYPRRTNVLLAVAQTRGQKPGRIGAVLGGFNPLSTSPPGNTYLVLSNFVALNYAKVKYVDWDDSNK